MSDELRALRKLKQDIALFGQTCFPTAYKKETPKFHKEIYDTFLDKAEDRILIAAPRGTAKAQSLDSCVLTKNGWTKFIDIDVGDKIIGYDGNETTVTHLHPIMTMDLYEVKTRDGRTMLCNEDHLFSVYILQNTKNNKLTIRSLRELIEIYDKPKFDKRNNKCYRENKVGLPICSPISFCKKEFGIDPYTLGIWLGDGHSAPARFTTVDTEILEYIPYPTKKTSGKYLYQIYGGLHKTLRLNNLLNNKHVPSEYFFGSIKQRESLLQGLIDTDGTVCKKTGLVSFCNKNERLIDDVVELVRSLGGIATKKSQLTRFDKDSEYKKSFRVFIRLPKEITPARLERKRVLYKGYNNLKTSIVSIKKVDTAFGRCITVSSDDGLYITDDYMVTHNSTISSLIFPLHQVAFKPSHEDLFIVIISESRQQSVNFLSRIKYHLDHSKQFKAIFGDYGRDTAKRWREDDIVLRNGSRIVAAGTGQRIRGFIEGDTRPNLIIMDDFESELNAFTPEARVKNKKWLTEAVMPSLSDNGRMVIIGTVISEDCFLYWAKTSKTWKVLWYEICNKNMTKSLWPEKFPISRIKKIKESFESIGNINGFFQEYMNEAQAPENAPFKPEFIRRHYLSLEKDNAGQWYLTNGVEKDNELGKEAIRKPVDLYQGIDPASSLSSKADFFVIATIAMDIEGKVYLVDLYVDRLEPAKQPQRVMDLYMRYRPKRVRIETVAYQEALRSGVRALMKEKDIYIPGLERGLKPRTAKSERLLSLVPLLAKGDFFFGPNHFRAEKEFLSYPKGKHDDIIDGIWMAIQGAKPCKVKELYIDTKPKKRKLKKIDWHIV